MADLDAETRYTITVQDDVTALLRADTATALRVQPRFGAILDGWGASLQDVENALFLSVTGVGGDTATGAALDRVGASVLEARLGLEDGPYRRVIQAKIRSLVSAGVRSEVVEILADLVGAQSVIGSDLPPVSVSLIATVDDAEVFAESALSTRVARAIDPAIEAGVAREVWVQDGASLIFGTMPVVGEPFTGPPAFGIAPLAHALDL